MPAANPKQVDGLNPTPVDDGFIIYDSAKDRVHYLNHAAALILILCDGRNSEDDIRALLQGRFQLTAPPDRDVAQILAQFLDEAWSSRRSRPPPSPDGSAVSALGPFIAFAGARRVPSVRAVADGLALPDRTRVDADLQLDLKSA